MYSLLRPLLIVILMKSLMRLQPQMDLIPKRNRLKRLRLRISNESQHASMTKIHVNRMEGIPLSPIDFESKRKAKVNGMCTI